MRNDFYSLQGTSLTRSFGSGETYTVALQDVSIELEQGQFGLIMGPSGSGKSTLLAVLSGLMQPDRGQVLVQGQDLWALSDAARRQFRLEKFGFIFQGFNLFPELTVREQLEMVLQWGEKVKPREARERVGEMLELLGLTKKADLLPAALSGGEKQRVAIGRALIKKPVFCFADEPTSALDWANGQPVVELLVAAARTYDATVVVVAHDPRIIPFADRVFHMKDGHLTEKEMKRVALTG